MCSSAQCAAAWLGCFRGHRISRALLSRVALLSVSLRRWIQLCQLLAVGLIADLHCQGAYVLVMSVKLQDFNCTKPAIRYDADFFYVEKDVEVIEDMKGVLTTEFKLKRHLMKALQGLEVRVVK